VGGEFPNTLFQVPLAGGGGGNPLTGLLQSLLGGGGATATATTDQTSNVIANPTFNQQGGIQQDLVLGPQIGGTGGSASAAGGGLFGFGGSSAKGGAGGSNFESVNYSPSLSLTSNPPPVPGFPSMPNLLQGGAQQNVVTPYKPMSPIMAGGSPTSLIGQMAPPIAAGGYLPMMPYPMNQQQQQSSSQEQILPGMASPASNGTAQQAGGYAAPPPQAPQGMSMMQRLQGAANPMVMSLTGPQQGTMDNSQQATPVQQAETGRAVAPDEPISQSAQDTIDELERLKGQVSPAAAQAIDNYTKSVAAKLGTHKANKDILEPKLQQAEAQRDAVTKEASDRAEPEGNAKELQATKDKIYNNKTPQEQQAITRGANNFKYKGSVHPKLRGALAVAGFLGNTGIARAARSMDTHMTALEKAEEVRDDKAYSQFLTEVHQAMSEQHANLATNLTGADASVTDYRSQLSHNDENLRQGIENSKDMYMAPGQMNLEALGKEASMAEHQATARGQGVREAEIPFQQSIAKGNLAAHQLSAGVAAQNAGLSREKFNYEQNKYTEGEPNRRANRIKDLAYSLSTITDQESEEGKKEAAAIKAELNKALNEDAMQKPMLSPEEARKELARRRNAGSK
jgi:hypothetical protein